MAPRLQPATPPRYVLRPESLEIVREDDPRAALQAWSRRERSGREGRVSRALRRHDAAGRPLQLGAGDLVPAGMMIGLAISADAAAVLPESEQ
jgi:hypothetical protein